MVSAILLKLGLFFSNFSTQGGCISHIMPEFLLEPNDYKKWLEISVREYNF